MLAFSPTPSPFLRPVPLSKGTRIVQADSGSDSDSESRHKAYSAGRFRFRLCAPTGTKNVLCLTVQERIVVAGSGKSVQTVGDRWFTYLLHGAESFLRS